MLCFTGHTSENNAMTFNKPATHLYLKWAKDINSHICRQGEICLQMWTIYK